MALQCLIATFWLQVKRSAQSRNALIFVRTVTHWICAILTVLNKGFKPQNLQCLIATFWLQSNIMVKENNCRINKDHICFMWFGEEIVPIEKCLDFCTDSYTLDMCYYDCVKEGYQTAECKSVPLPNTPLRCCCFT
ncbi:hypothetical protein HID58_010791 [Brassica napus]|uniref:Defensin-like domain-containing protein n=1 Tax=Brassica napus TaxID=3708 RepID=A0ABQ8DWK3_BRANA|nr:hypothetical protein HID58_010791 [Brassica napus]